MRLFAPGFLLLLPLALLPLIIHLLSRLRLRRKEFPSLLLLETVRRERFSWLRLKEILLLVLRTLALLLLLFALTRPYLPRALPGLVRTDRLLIILDDSYSMGYGNHWQNGLTLTRQLINSTSRPYLLLASRPDTLFTGQCPANNLLDTLKPSATAATLIPALQQAAALFATAPLPVVVITDLQQRSLNESLPGIPSEYLRILNVGTQGFDNAGITRVDLQDNRIQVEIFNYGALPVQRILRLQLPTQTEELTVNLPARARTNATFSYQLQEPGTYTGTVELISDSLNLDNIRYFVFTIPKPHQVPVFTSAAATGHYLYLALGADTTRFQPVLMDITLLGRTDLRKFPVIIITDMAALLPADFDRLQFYLNAGGSGLICAPPPLPENSGFNRYLKILGSSPPAGFVSPMEIDTNHPVLDIFRKTDLTTVRIFRHSRLAGGSALIRLTDGDPMILELPDQHLIIWSFAPIPEATDLIYKAAFAPLLHRTIAYLTALALKSAYTVGDTIRFFVSSTRPILLATPRGDKTVVPEPTLPRPSVLFTDTRSPGIYRLQDGENQTIAVNPFPEEGDLTSLPPSQLTAKGIKVQTGSAAIGAELTLTLLYLAALLFALEMLILALERNQRKMPV
jgi:hypothetical protein